MRSITRGLVRNRALLAGAILMLALLTFAILGQWVVNAETARPMSAPANLAPTFQYPFGTDTAGRNLLAAIIVGTLETMKIGLLAGGIGVLAGAAIGLFAGYYRGWIDAVLVWAVDVALTIPPLLILVVIASTLKESLTSTGLAVIIALFSWREAARQIRSQVLSLRERPFVVAAKISGMSGPEIVIREIAPNVIPYLAANFVLATSAAVLASIGLQAIGLGSTREVTLGSTIYWMMTNSAFMRGMWWWVCAPIAVLVILFLALYFLSIGLDRWANPRLRPT
jgi:peptide/nickel transport system permease protein